METGLASLANSAGKGSILIIIKINNNILEE